jgi:hypothetical protein
MPINCPNLPPVLHFTCKPESHAGLYDSLAFLDKNNDIEKVTKRHWNGKYGEIWQYRFANQVPLRNGNDTLLVNWQELVITHEKTGEILYQNSFFTNQLITSANIAQITEVGRTRWKIENENKNTLTPALAGGARETKSYHLEHNFGHGKQNLANIVTTLNIPAFFIHTIQELLEPAYQRLRRALGARKTFFNDLRALTRYVVFETWDDLFSFMEEGLEIAIDPPR